MIKILHLTTVHDRNDPRILLKQCTSLAKNGFEVSLIVSDKLSNEIRNNVNIISIGVFPSRFSLKKITTILTQIKKLKPKVIHFHDPELILIGLLIKIIFGIKIIYDIHEDYITSLKTKKFPILIKGLLKYLFILLEYIARISFTTIIAEKYYQKRFPKAVKVLNYPVVSDYDKFIERSFSTKKLIYSGNVTLSRGAINHTNIVNFSDLYSVHFIGKCDKIIYENIKDIGKENMDRIYLESVDKYVPFSIIQQRYKEDWLAGLAIFPYSVHYYKKELTKFFEYMYEGLPIVCSNFPVWKSLIVDNNCGLCVDPLNEKEIIEAINFLYKNPDKAKEMGENGKHLVQKFFNWEKEEEILIELYNKLLE